jgi:hypothetical protein
MMKVTWIAVLLLLFCPPLLSEDGHDSAEPKKTVERFNRTRTDTFEDSNGDGLNDLRTKGSESSSPFKGFLDIINDRISTDDDRGKGDRTPSKKKETQSPSSKPATKKAPTSPKSR